jgi:hypothetical protein
LKAKQEIEREDKELKAKEKLKRIQEMKERQEDQEKRDQVKKMKVLDLSTKKLFIQLLKPSLRISLKLFFY